MFRYRQLFEGGYSWSPARGGKVRVRKCGWFWTSWAPMRGASGCVSWAGPDAGRGQRTLAWPGGPRRSACVCTCVCARELVWATWLGGSPQYGGRGLAVWAALTALHSRSKDAPAGIVATRPTGAVGRAVGRAAGPGAVLGDNTHRAVAGAAAALPPLLRSPSRRLCCRMCLRASMRPTGGATGKGGPMSPVASQGRGRGPQNRAGSKEAVRPRSAA